MPRVVLFLIPYQPWSLSCHEGLRAKIHADTKLAGDPQIQMHSISIKIARNQIS